VFLGGKIFTRGGGGRVGLGVVQVEVFLDKHGPIVEAFIVMLEKA